jgi:hypothetical protein
MFEEVAKNSAIGQRYLQLCLILGAFCPSNPTDMTRTDASHGPFGTYTFSLPCRAEPVGPIRTGKPLVLHKQIRRGDLSGVDDQLLEVKVSLDVLLDHLEGY